MQLRHANARDASAISALVQAGFVEHIASDWEPSARQSFIEDTSAEKLAPKLAEAAICIAAVQGDQVLGVIFLPRPTLVQLLFIAPEHLRKGIARSLWSAVRAQLAERHPEVTTVELNSSPYAVGAYRALGFFPISQPFRRKGAVATRMACWLPGEALEQVAT
ncbi:MAG: GNAT family N-acetyltransferase [Burkholderiales bacterium]|nr:GNAT family N-acetyltransferase [Burkholderiales bacterium]